MGLMVAGVSLFALPGAVGAQTANPYPPGGEQLPPPVNPLPPTAGVAAGGATRPSADSLPATGGSDPSQILWIASGALLAGVAISGIAVRRRNVDHAAV